MEVKICRYITPFFKIQDQKMLITDGNDTEGSDNIKNDSDNDSNNNSNNDSDNDSDFNITYDIGNNITNPLHFPHFL
jgi:hypothetical protein